VDLDLNGGKDYSSKEQPPPVRWLKRCGGGWFLKSRRGLCGSH